MTKCQNHNEIKSVQNEKYKVNKKGKNQKCHCLTTQTWRQQKKQHDIHKTKMKKSTKNEVGYA